MKLITREGTNKVYNTPTISGGRGGRVPWPAGPARHAHIRVRECPRERARQPGLVGCMFVCLFWLDLLPVFCINMMQKLVLGLKDFFNLLN